MINSNTLSKAIETEGKRLEDIGITEFQIEPCSNYREFGPYRCRNVLHTNLGSIKFGLVSGDLGGDMSGKLKANGQWQGYMTPNQLLSNKGEVRATFERYLAVGLNKAQRSLEEGNVETDSWVDLKLKNIESWIVD